MGKKVNKWIFEGWEIRQKKSYTGAVVFGVHRPGQNTHRSRWHFPTLGEAKNHISALSAARSSSNSNSSTQTPPP